MGLDQNFYRKSKSGELVEVAYFRKNWGLHEFINTLKTVGNCKEVVLTRDELDKVVVFLRENPLSDIFNDEVDGELELSIHYTSKIGAIAYYDELIYYPNW